jgi:hypothetical protein
MGYDEFNTWIRSHLFFQDQDNTLNSVFPDMHRVYMTYRNAEHICSTIEIPDYLSYGWIPSREIVDKWLRVCLEYSCTKTPFQLFANTFLYGFLNEFVMNTAIKMVALGWLVTPISTILEVSEKCDRFAVMTDTDCFSGVDCAGIGHNFNLHSLVPWGPDRSDPKSAFVSFANAFKKVVSLCNDINGFTGWLNFYKFPVKHIDEYKDVDGRQVTVGRQLCDKWGLDYNSDFVRDGLQVGPGARPVGGAVGNPGMVELYRESIQKIRSFGRSVFQDFLRRSGVPSVEWGSKLWMNMPHGTTGGAIGIEDQKKMVIKISVAEIQGDVSYREDLMIDQL